MNSDIEDFQMLLFRYCTKVNTEEAAKAAPGIGIAACGVIFKYQIVLHKMLV